MKLWVVSKMILVCMGNRYGVGSNFPLFTDFKKSPNAAEESLNLIRDFILDLIPKPPPNPGDKYNYADIYDGRFWLF